MGCDARHSPAKPPFAKYRHVQAAISDPFLLHFLSIHSFTLFANTGGGHPPTKKFSKTRTKMNHQTNVYSSTEPTANPHGFQKPPSTLPPAVSSESSSETSPRVTVDPKPATRCAHLFPSGRRCRRKPFDAANRFCPRHAKLPENLQPDDLTSELTANPGDLDTFDGLHSLLEDLLILLARTASPRAAPPSSPTSPTNSSAP